MKANFNQTMLAVAITALFGISAAHAQDTRHSTSVTVKKDVSLRSNVNVDGRVQLDGRIAVDAAATAITDNTQNLHDEQVENNAQVANTATVDGHAGDKATGNVGANVAAGNFNAQGNTASIAAAGSASDDASFAFNCSGSHCGGNHGNDPSAGGMADAETFARQSGMDNTTDNAGTTNDASVRGNAFNHASGNIGVNVASGDTNQQLNSLSAATTKNNVYAMATATLDQESAGNSATNDPGWLYCDDLQATSNSASLSGSAFANASGNIGVNVAAGSGNLQSNSLSMAVAGQ